MGIEDLFGEKEMSDETEIKSNNIPQDCARQAFGRGLCFYNDFIIGGSSPATISVYAIGYKKTVEIVNISKDIRNAIHGLEVWIY